MKTLLKNIGLMIILLSLTNACKKDEIVDKDEMVDKENSLGHPGLFVLDNKPHYIDSARVNYYYGVLRNDKKSSEMINDWVLYFYTMECKLAFYFSAENIQQDLNSEIQVLPYYGILTFNNDSSKEYILNSGKILISSEVSTYSIFLNDITWNNTTTLNSQQSKTIGFFKGEIPFGVETTAND